MAVEHSPCPLCKATPPHRLEWRDAVHAVIIAVICARCGRGIGWAKKDDRVNRMLADRSGPKPTHESEKFTHAYDCAFANCKLR